MVLIRTAARLLEWASSNYLLKVTRISVPTQILPAAISSATLCDVKVNPRRGQPDDEIYHKHAEIRRFVPRGLCLLEYICGTETRVVVLVSAMHKFSGGMGDEDDADVTDDQEWQRFFVAPIEQTNVIVQTSKENGEAAHYSAFKFEEDTTNQVYHVAGSKHVHLLVRSAADVALYVEPRFLVARRVASAVLTSLELLDISGRQQFIDHLLEHNLTTSFEILQPDYQHIELFDFQHAKLVFISFTRNAEAVSTESEESQSTITTLCQDPRLGAEVARAAGFATITLAEWPLDDMERLFTQIRSGYGKEGSVLYFVDGDHNVIGLLKKKTMWYILVRAIREKCKGLAHQYRKEIPTTSAIPVSSKKTTSRINAIQKWLGFSDDEKEQWSQLALGLFEWVEPKLASREITPDEIASLFPVVWNRYLTETNRSDNIFHGVQLS